MESLARGSEFPSGSYPGGNAAGGDDGGRDYADSGYNGATPGTVSPQLAVVPRRIGLAKGCRSLCRAQPAALGTYRRPVLALSARCVMLVGLRIVDEAV